MLKNKFINIIQNNINKNRSTQINRKYIDTDPLVCIPLTLGEELLMVRYMYDFSFDGFKIIRLTDISSVRSGKYERFIDKILKEEGINEQKNIYPIEDIDNWKSALYELGKIGENIAIECEGVEYNSFFIGKIEKIEGNSMFLLCFDALGVWEQEATEIQYCGITSISFGSRYIKTISRHLKLGTRVVRGNQNDTVTPGTVQ